MVDGVEDRVRRHVKRGYGAVKRYAKGHATEAVLVRRRVSARRSSISSVLDPDKTDVFGLGVLHVSTGERGKERSASEAVWLRGRGLWERLMDMPYSPLLIDTAVDGSQVIVAATFWGSVRLFWCGEVSIIHVWGIVCGRSGLVASGRCLRPLSP